MDLTTARDILQRSSTDLGDPGKDRDYGHGLLNALRAFGAYNVIREEVLIPIASKAVAAPPQQQPSPGGEIDESHLIIRLNEESIISAKGLNSIGSTLSAKGVALTSSHIRRDNLVLLNDSADIVQMRNQLLAEEGIVAVYYNYIYHPM